MTGGPKGRGGSKAIRPEIAAKKFADRCGKRTRRGSFPTESRESGVPDPTATGSLQVGEGKLELSQKKKNRGRAGGDLRGGGVLEEELDKAREGKPWWGGQKNLLAGSLRKPEVLERGKKSSKKGQDKRIFVL